MTPFVKRTALLRAILGVVVGVAILPATLMMGSAGPWSTPVAQALGAASNSSNCVPPGSTSPDSLLIPLAQPSGGLSTILPGETVGAAFQLQLLNLPANFSGTRVHLPTVEAVFFLSSGTLAISFSPRVLTVNGTGWTSPISLGQTVGTMEFFTSSTAHLTTNWEAVMSDSAYGRFELQFHWQWFLQFPLPASGYTYTGAWSAGVNQSTTSEQPSTFFPAPYVGVGGSAPQSEAANSTYWLNLTGNVSGTSFRTVVETPTGHEVISQCTTSSAGVSTYNDTVPLRYANGTPIPQGSYLVHVHNAGGAIVVFAKLSVI